MDLSYFGYYLKHVPSGDRHLVDCRPLADAFAKLGSPQLRAAITWYGDHLYLLPFGSKAYLFVQSRDQEIIKSIEGKTFSVDDIQKKLLGDSVGFASYVYLDANHLAIATKVLSPRVQAFASLMTQLVHAAGGVEFMFTPRALTTKVTKAAAKKFAHVGAITLEMSASSSFAADLISQVTGIAGQNLANVASVELKIAPVRKGKKNLNDELAGILGTVPDNAIDRLEIRGKAELAGRVTDYYIGQEGGLRDPIRYSKEDELKAVIPHMASCTHNARLATKVGNLKNDVHLKKVANLSALGISTALVASAPPVTTPIAVAKPKRRRRAP